MGLPDSSGIFPGMFGRLLIPLPSRQAVLVPEEAVTRTGQLEMVTIQTEKGWSKISIQTGRKFDDGRLEVLSGLSGGEILALSKKPPEQNPVQER